MSQQKLLKKVLSVLNQAGIQYMLTGSIVSSLQGEPRSTHDIDVVQYRKLNLEYLEHWAKELGVESPWERLKDEAETE